MENDIVDALNISQKNALLQTEGAVLVTAGAGSGKTKLLTHRIAYLMQNLGVSPFNILAITFTNKASKEMKERVCSLCENGDKVWISTFHSLCAKILRINAENLNGYNNNFTILSDSDTDKIFKAIFTHLNIIDEEEKKCIIYHISNVKNNGYDITDYCLTNSYLDCVDNLKYCYMAYQEKLLKTNCMDFDDLLLNTVILFKTCPDVLQKYTERFKYVLIDEFQDTNKIQYDLVKMLASGHKNIFAVGDEDQCIYSWRGANFKNIFDFKNDFENCKVFKLEQNYRSSKKILEYANKIIKNNKTRLDKVLFTENFSGFEPECKQCYSDKDEANYVCQTINTLVRVLGYKYGDIAVLGRLNALSLPFEERFMSYNIPYKIFGGFKFYDRAEIKNVVSYLKLFINPRDELAFLRIINFPKRGIGEGAITKLREFAISQNVSLCEACVLLNNIKPSGPLSKFIWFGQIYENLKNKMANLSTLDFIIEVVKDFNIKGAYDKNIETELNKILNIDQFIISCQDFFEKNSDYNLTEYLENLSLISDLDDFENEDDCVKFATIHSVKGLEFKVVFIIGLEEKIFPIIRASSNVMDEIEEERRLMYVAITRAKERLFLSYTQQRFMYGEFKQQLPSRFLNELGILKSTNIERAQLNYQSAVKNNIGFSAKLNFIPTFKTQNIPQVSTLLKDEEEIIIENKLPIKIKVGDRVEHPKYGEGVVCSISNGDADINFDKYGVKTLILKLAPLKVLED